MCFWFSLKNISVCVPECVYHMGGGAGGGQKTALDPLELE